MKRVITSEKTRVANKAKKSELATIEKKFRSAIEAKDASATELGRQVCSKLDKAAKTGTIHKNKADRKKGQIMAIASSAK